MKHCYICEREFNPDEEISCKICREQSLIVSFELYSEALERIKALELAVQDFIDNNDHPWVKKFKRILEGNGI